MRSLKYVKPTPELLNVIEDAGQGFRLIRGAAGCGKTTVALNRLRQLCSTGLARKKRLENQQPLRALFLTFNRTLRGYVMRLVIDHVPANDLIRMNVETFGSWARELTELGDSREEEVCRTKIRSLLKDVGVRSEEMRYFEDEVNYILGRFPPDGREGYLNVTRTGRGRTPAVNRDRRKKLLSNVIEPYEQFKLGRDILDWYDVALIAETVESRDYDVVILDEAQDFSAIQIRAVLAHLGKEHSTTFVMDASQRIYPQYFHWKELGINLHSSLVYSLSNNYRNTEQIARFAFGLIRDLPAEEKDAGTSFENCKRIGPLPKMYAGRFAAQLSFMLNDIHPHLNKDETVGILHPKGGAWFDFIRWKLGENNIRYCELSRNGEWPVGPELVALSTISSAKGLEFDHVLLPGLNQEVTLHGSEEGDGTLYALRRLLAMGITRARKNC